MVLISYYGPLILTALVYDIKKIDRDMQTFLSFTSVVEFYGE